MKPAPRDAALAALVALAVTGCASPGPGDRAPAEFARIASGQPAAAVRAALGTPDRNLWLRAEGREAWGYKYQGPFQRRVFWIEFSADGRVHSTSDAKDLEASSYRSY